MMTIDPCELCPRRCRAHRATGKVGYCKSGPTLKMFRWGPHFGEEPPIAGDRGSGTLFFSHCTLRCIYCQNAKWSNGGQGEEISINELIQRMRTLAEKGCHNWNLVSPTPWLPHINEAVKQLHNEGLHLPIVYNTSGYERTETLEAFPKLANIALADLRYAQPASAWEGSNAKDYVEVARNAIQWFWNHLGPLQYDSDGIAQQGLIVRLLALPGRCEEVCDNLRWLYQTLGPKVAISVMAQYHPVGPACHQTGWNRRVTPEEFEEIQDLLDLFEFETGWVQPCEAATAENMLGDDMSAGYGIVQ